MAQNKIEIFDDSVLKLTVNQGTEEERVEKTLGDFNMGELAFVRNTGRLFVGDCSDDNTVPTTMPDGELNYTKGGILTGNRYLGMIDSKPLVDLERNIAGNKFSPLNYEGNTNFYAGSKTYTEKPMVGNTTGESKFKRKNIVDGGENVFRWDKKAQYNEKYDAYDGDIAYDVYENAIILFDKKINNYNDNILVKDEETQKYTHPHTAGTGEDEVQIFKENGVPITDIDGKLNVKYRTPTIEMGAAENKIYGDGYVIFRNVEPDNVTLKFVEKNFEKNGEPGAQNKAGYSHNVLAIKAIPSDIVLDSLNFDQEQFDKDKTTIKIVNNLSWVESIGSSDKSLSIPKKINIENSKFEFLKPGDLKNDKNKVLAARLNNDHYDISVEDPFTYAINLGDGLTSNVGKSLKLGINETPTIMLDLNESEYFNGCKDPFNIYENNEITPATSYTSPAYVGELMFTGGSVAGAKKYDQTYYNDALTWINKYESDDNIAYNRLKKPLALLWTSNATGSACNVRASFINGPFLFCKNSDNKSNVNLFASGGSRNSVLDLNTGYSYNSTGVKKVLRYYDAYVEEKIESGVTKLFVENGLKQEVIFQWIEEKVVEALVEKKKYYALINNVKTEISKVFINDTDITAGKEGVTTDEKDDVSPNITYRTIYKDNKSMLSEYYSQIYYTLKNEDDNKIKVVDLVKDNLVKFVTESMLNITSSGGKVLLGKNNEYTLDKAYQVNNNFELVEITSTITWNNLIGLNGIVLAVYDSDEPEPENPDDHHTIKYLYYNHATCNNFENYKEPASGSISAENQVRIPEHATSVLLEVNIYNSEEQEIAVFTSNLYDNLKNCTGTLVTDTKPYTYTSGEQPTFDTGTNSVLNKGVNETKILSVRSKNHTSIIEVPVYHDKETGKLEFCFRAGNIKPSSTGTFLINLIGYKL